MTVPYPPFLLEVRTPRLVLRAATDERLAELLPLVRKGIVQEDEAPFDDPISFYEESPEREWRWLRAQWRARSRVEPGSWRLNLVIDVDGELLGMQDLIAEDFATFGTVTTFSWLALAARGRGLGKEARAAVLHLAFAGFGAQEASSEAFVDNAASNATSRSLGYQENGVDWATRRGEPAQLQKWTLARERWTARPDIELHGVEECRPVLGLKSL